MSTKIDTSVVPVMTVDSFRILEVTENPLAIGEHRDWSIRHAGLDKIPYRGKGQRVGILDTGIDKFHQDLEGQVTAANFIAGNKESPAWRDTCGHGTFCTGQIVAKENGVGIVGAAPQATAFHGKVLYGDKRDYSRIAGRSDISAAIRACVTDGCGVISMSIGGPGRNKEIQQALEYAVSRGVIPVAAAGNERLEGSPYASYPASYPTVISVASANKQDMPAWFSTMAYRGTADTEEARLTAPEIAVASLEFYWGCGPGLRTYLRMIGTSMATPMIAATALLWREARLLSGTPFPTGEAVLREFRAWLRRVAKDTNKNGWDAELGYGVLLLGDGDL